MADLCIIWIFVFLILQCSQIFVHSLAVLIKPMLVIFEYLIFSFFLFTIWIVLLIFQIRYVIHIFDSKIDTVIGESIILNHSVHYFIS